MFFYLLYQDCWLVRNQIEAEILSLLLLSSSMWFSTGDSQRRQVVWGHIPGVRPQFKPMSRLALSFVDL